MQRTKTAADGSAQRGISFIGFLFVAAVVLIAALIAFRMIPAYIEWYTVERALKAVMVEVGDPTVANVKRAMERKMTADYVDPVTWRDLEVTKEGNTIVASTSWQRKLPLVYNVSLLIDFDVSVSR